MTGLVWLDVLSDPLPQKTAMWIWDGRIMTFVTLTRTTCGLSRTGSLVVVCNCKGLITGEYINQGIGFHITQPLLFTSLFGLNVFQTDQLRRDLSIYVPLNDSTLWRTSR